MMGVGLGVMLNRLRRFRWFYLDPGRSRTCATLPREPEGCAVSARQSSLGCSLQFSAFGGWPSACSICAATEFGRGLTTLGVLATFILEIPSAWKGLRGGAMPEGAAFVSTPQAGA